VPPFLQPLVRVLPAAVAPGQRPDVDLILAILLASPKLDPARGGLGPVGPASLPHLLPPPGMGLADPTKRARGDDGDSDDERGGGPATNVFRQRQKARVL
jgi:hypothetical protein